MTKLTDNLQRTVTLLRTRGSGAHAGWVEEAIRELDGFKNQVEKVVPVNPTRIKKTPSKHPSVDLVKNEGHSGTGADDD